MVFSLVFITLYYDTYSVMYKYPRIAVNVPTKTVPT
jgi:hypothetical protein